MIWPHLQTLLTIENHLSPRLVPPKAVSNLKTLMGGLPQSLSSYYIECRLSDSSDQIDFLSSIIASDGGRQRLSEDAGHTLLNNPAWHGIGNFITSWTDDDSSLHHRIPLFWFEFDHMEQDSSEVPLPGFMFCLDPEYGKTAYSEENKPLVNHHNLKETTEQVYRLLLAHPLPSTVKESLFACFDALPSGGQIIHVSVMHQRQPPIVKLYVSVPKRDLVDYLDQLKWAGSQSELNKLIDTFCSSSTDVRIDLGFDTTILPAIGIVFSEVSVTSSHNTSDKSILDLIVEKRLCTNEKRDELAAWPGVFFKTYNNHSWPTRIHKWLDIKLVYQPNRSLTAKGYLGFAPGFSIL